MNPNINPMAQPILFTAEELADLRGLVASILGFWGESGEDAWDPATWPLLIARFNPATDVYGFQQRGWDFLDLMEAAKTWTILYQVGIPGVPFPGAWTQDVILDVRAEWE